MVTADQSSWDAKILRDVAIVARQEQRRVCAQVAKHFAVYGDGRSQNPTYDKGWADEHLPPRARFVVHTIFLLEFARRKQLEENPALIPWSQESLNLFRVVLQASAFAATMTALVYEEEMPCPTVFQVEK